MSGAKLSTAVFHVEPKMGTLVAQEAVDLPGVGLEDVTIGIVRGI